MDEECGTVQHQALGLLALETVFGLIEDVRGRRFEDLCRHFFSPVCREAVHEERAGFPAKAAMSASLT